MIDISIGRCVPEAVPAPDLRRAPGNPGWVAAPADRPASAANQL